MVSAAVTAARCVSLPILLAGVMAAQAAAAPPPANRTYFALLTGLEGPYSVEGECLEFTATEVCTYKMRCGTWWETEPGGSESGVAFELSFADNDVPYQVDGQGRIDARGKRDSLAGVARLRTPRGALNYGMAGRSTTGRRCFRLLRDFNNSPLSRDRSCVEGAVFAAPEETPYVLPYPVGASSSISQSYCFVNDSHRDGYAYDFRMPIGSEIVAARAGEVVAVDDRFPDDPEASGTNSIIIEQDDGTEAIYGHLRQNGARVEAGERVEAGDLIGYSGDSSSGGFPHLHFEIYRAGRSVPVSFRNVDGPLDERGGLMFGYVYTATPYQ